MRIWFMKKIVILISGGGSNMQAILARARAREWQSTLGAEVACVISNTAKAPGLSIAQEWGVPTHVLEHDKALSEVTHAEQASAVNAARLAFEKALIALIDPYSPALVVLAGFMRILTPYFVEHYAGRLINIHPSLLPAFTGLHTHARALQMGCQFAGATVHRVTAQLDQGPILAQAVVPVLPGDDAQSLGARVLTQEHLLYPQVIERLLRVM